MHPKKLISGIVQQVGASPVLPWVLLFAILSLAVTQYGGTNARSRIAALRAMTEGQSLSIDNYVDWTYDWSLSPNGHYYSNKAPGAALFGLPIFSVLDYPVRLAQEGRRDTQGRVPEPGYLELTIFNVLMQIAPFSFLILSLSLALYRRGSTVSGMHFFALAALFGNTAAIYMNCYFGHGLAAIFFLAGFASWLWGRYGWAGFFFAATMLTDYGGACVIPFFLIAALYRERNWHPLKEIVAGAFPVSMLWIWYHVTTFDSPFAIASQFINPSQVVAVQGSENLWGTVSFFPSTNALIGLLFGTERGLLVTQPWVLLSIFLLLLPRAKLPRGTAILLLGGFGAALWMNASVGGWSGGFTLGPRYLAFILPAFALAAAWSWQNFSAPVRLALWAGLSVALLFRLWTYPFSNLAPFENLWVYHWMQYRDSASSTPYGRLALAVVLISIACAWALKRNRARAA
jgi:hypothetical protein